MGGPLVRAFGTLSSAGYEETRLSGSERPEARTAKGPGAAPGRSPAVSPRGTRPRWRECAGEGDCAHLMRVSGYLRGPRSEATRILSSSKTEPDRCRGT